MEAVKTVGLFLAEAGERRDSSRLARRGWHLETERLGEGRILAAFSGGVLAEFASGSLSFIDKDTIPARRFKVVDGCGSCRAARRSVAARSSPKAS